MKFRFVKHTSPAEDVTTYHTEVRSTMGWDYVSGTLSSKEDVARAMFDRIVAAGTHKPVIEVLEETP